MSGTGCALGRVVPARPPIHAALRHHRLMKWIARSGPFCPPSRPSWCFIGGVAPRTPPDRLAAGASRRLGREARGRSPRKNLHRGNGRTSGREPTPHNHREQATQGPRSRYIHSTQLNQKTTSGVAAPASATTPERTPPDVQGRGDAIPEENPKSGRRVGRQRPSRRTLSILPRYFKI